ncbi:MAG: ribonuclease III [Vicinamibacterales bacterium]
MSDLVIIFRTHSDIEASIVRGLLETHGIPSMVSSDVPHSILPLTVDGLGEVRISVRADSAEDAHRIIESHRTQVPDGQVVRIRDEFEDLERIIEYRFRDRGLLEHSLTHTSRANEDASGGVIDNESLEFLGDAVLGFVVADMLFQRFPDYTEGQKSKIKAALVSTTSLAQLAEHLNLGDHLLLGRGEEKTGGRRKQALLADGFEALIAAIYLDGGVEQARAFILRNIADLVDEIEHPDFVARDFKSAIQERLQSIGLSLPEYRVTGSTGPDHHKLFHVELRVQGSVMAQASGRSKKEAEQQAAKAALEKLDQEEG